MTAVRLFQTTLLLVLWYFVAGLVFSRWLDIWPDGYEREGFFLVAAALPWSLLALDFHRPTDSLAGAAVRDMLFLMVLGLGIATNAVIARFAVGATARGIRESKMLRRAARTSDRTP
jgi:hypothetical protein